VNSNNNHYLALSGLELYGLLTDLALVNPGQKPPAPLIPAPPQGISLIPAVGNQVNQVGNMNNNVNNNVAVVGQLPISNVNNMGNMGMNNNLMQPVQQLPQQNLNLNMGYQQQNSFMMNNNNSMSLMQSASVQNLNQNMPQGILPISAPPLLAPFVDGLEFKYTTDFDKNGVVYWLGSNRYTQEWKNPGMTGIVRATSSPLAMQPSPSAPAWAALGRDVTRCVTQPSKESWFCFDFVNIWIKPTAYTLRHYDSWDQEALRDWKLQGSNDGKKWSKILSHKKDESLNKKGATHTWQLPKVKKSYRMFRILQTGKNSNGHWFCALAGFEIYGKIFASRKS
jgi:hypothetical protein